MGQERLPVRWSEGTLTPTLQVANQPPQHEAISTVENTSRITLRKVAAPSRQMPTNVSHQFVDRHKTAATGGQLPHTVAKSGQRAFRGKHVEISSAATKEVAIETERVSEKIHARRRLLQVDRPRLRPVDGQT